MSTRISETFEQLRSSGHIAFMPFITAGDPDLSMTQSILRGLSDAGVDLIEIGFPYSDPIADGPVIQASYTRALGHKTTVQQIFDAIAELETNSMPPLLAMVSYAIIMRHGSEEFARHAKESGFSGLIVPDLPGDEAQDLFAITQQAGLDLVQLVAPTTPRERVRAILKSCSGFVYSIAVAGTTGVRESLAEELTGQLKWLREETSLPLAVGFGISGPKQVAPLRGLADGVIVGSGIVRHFQKLADGEATAEETLAQVSSFAKTMAEAAHEGDAASSPA